ncbi:hypothetical protein ASG11_14890 [Sphingomonas sp. Leaf357]|uniref:lysozyme inhibitor LprI family protein n=1 Tax=Sphingomonas sp. Leaf357 TaxID=1736350 RepID=UPI000700731C|nr:lysozyme inhibitor LprI family protein [Sphingomonas sp. Leaf357]KQS02078.1 hypothetical protein ASG11_14890 [Sphingomonas sp. Leaf357]
MILSSLLLAVQVPMCDDRDGDLAAAECWYEAGRAADARLNKVWPDILEAAREADRVFSATPHKSHASAAADLLASQRAWLKYRNAQCPLEGDYAQGGSLENVIVGRCEAELTLQRIKQLQDIAAGFREN